MVRKQISSLRSDPLALLSLWAIEGNLVNVAVDALVLRRQASKRREQIDSLFVLQN